MLFLRCVSYHSGWRPILLAATVVLVSCSSASATQIALTFSGSVTRSLVPSISVGTPYSGRVLYDTTDPLFTTGQFDWYSFQPSDMLAITVGSCTFTGSGPASQSGMGFNGVVVAHHQVYNGQLVGDLFEAITSDFLTSSCPALSPNEVFFEIVGPPGLLIGDGIPSSFDLTKVVQPAYSGYETSDGVFLAENQYFQGNLTSIQVASVPEPSTLILVGSILCGLVVVRPAAKIRPR
jgi:hypothetical protein